GTPAPEPSHAVDPRLESLRVQHEAAVRHRERLRNLLVGGRTPLFRVVDPPRVPTVPVGPDRLPMLLFVVFVSLAAGIVVAFVAEMARMTRIRDAADVDYFLGVPVFAEIPAVIDVTLVRKQRIRRGLRSMSAIAAATGALPLLVLLWAQSGTL